MVRTEELSIGYGGRSMVEGISFEACPGECILLCGSNGSGKSTLMKTLAGLLQPIGGRIECDGTMVLVPTGIPKVKGFTMREFIRTGCYRDTNLWGKASERMSREMDEAMDLLDITELADRDISEISDGEFQKACIASALTRNASVLLLDEPTAFLDVDSRATVLQALAKIAMEKGKTILFSSHDIHESAAVCTRILGIGRTGRFADSLLSSKENVLSECFASFGKA